MKNLTLAGCVILDKSGKVLLIHRNTPTRIQWEVPGGKVEEGEKSKDTAIREVKEEIGIDVEIIKELGKKEFQEDQYLMDYIWFLATIKSGKPDLMEEKYDGLKYFSWEELKERTDLSANTQNLVSAYFARGFNIKS